MLIDQIVHYTIHDSLFDIVVIFAFTQFLFSLKLRVVISFNNKFFL